MFFFFKKRLPAYSPGVEAGEFFQAVEKEKVVLGW